MSTPTWWLRPWQSRRAMRIAAAVMICMLFWQWVPLMNYEWPSRLPVYSWKSGYLDTSDYSILNVSGYINTGRPGQPCQKLEYGDEIRVQQSWHLEDDLVQVAEAVKGHPMIDYSTQDKSWTWEETVGKTWTRLSGSSVWLEEYGVFLGITRVLFYDKGVKHWSVVSFLRGQIYDADWNELFDYTINWEGKTVTFPTVFNVASPYKEGGAFFGPEDPRVIIEHGVRHAEPIVIFNMINDPETGTRAMHLFRPFSNVTTILTISKQKQRANSEKNWAPFFHNEHDMKHPSHFIHFIYNFSPLTILKCHVLHGWCNDVFKQTQGVDVPNVRVSGGTQLVVLPVRSKPGLRVYVGMPRAHIEAGCKLRSMYRPELMVLTAQGNDYRLSFMSGSIDFGTAALDAGARADPCGQDGRILIANSIAKWERTRRADVMTIAFSVGDSTVQVIRLAGVAAFIERLPYLGDGFGPLDNRWATSTPSEWRDASQDVLTCSLEAASNYSIATAESVNGWAKDESDDAKEKWMMENGEKFQNAHEAQLEEERKAEEDRQQLEAEEDEEDAWDDDDWEDEIGEDDEPRPGLTDDG